MNAKLISSLPPLSPVQVVDVKTGEVASDWVEPVVSLLGYVQTETVSLYEENAEKLHAEYSQADNRVGSANSFARQRGYHSSYRKLSANILAKSRINELVLHKLVSESFAYHMSENPKKQPPSFAKKLNLGAVDKQMASLSVSGHTLWLEWKVWDRHLLLEFNIPSYILKRDIIKWSLPTVQISNKTDLPVFYFTVQESPTVLTENSVVGGVDLGRVEPFTLAVIDSTDGRLVKKVTSDYRLKELSRKRERLLTERKQVLTKLNHYKNLNCNKIKQETLQEEADRLRSKIRKIGKSLAAQSAANLIRELKKYNVTVLHLENLKWVTGAKYGGRWNHGDQQDSIVHAASRAGIKTRKINPKNSSQTCHKCGTKIIHSPKNRTVHCQPCKTVLDRDYNAAINIAKNRTYPHSYSKLRGNCSPKGQVMRAPQPLGVVKTILSTEKIQL